MSKHYIKEVLKEEVEKITRLAIFDFDATLIDTPLPEQGMQIYKKVTGKDWPYKGWWGRRESLDMDIFDMPANRAVVSDYVKERQNKNTLTVLLTGRIPPLEKEVKKILDSNSLKFDEYHFNTGGSTLNFKLHVLDELLKKYPDVKSVHMWEDRVEHVPSFEQWGESNPIDFDITVVESNHHI